MRKLAILPATLLLMAQMAPPPVVTVTAEDRMVISESLEKLRAYLLARDPSAEMRVREVEHGLAWSFEVGPTSLPLVGMALSRNSQDPRACALLQRIEPSAVCVK